MSKVIVSVSGGRARVADTSGILVSAPASADGMRVIARYCIDKGYARDQVGVHESLSNPGKYKAPPLDYTKLLLVEFDRGQPPRPAVLSDILYCVVPVNYEYDDSSYDKQGLGRPAAVYGTEAEAEAAAVTLSRAACSHANPFDYGDKYSSYYRDHVSMAWEVWRDFLLENDVVPPGEGDEGAKIPADAPSGRELSDWWDAYGPAEERYFDPALKRYGARPNPLAWDEAQRAAAVAYLVIDFYCVVPVKASPAAAELTRRDD